MSYFVRYDRGTCLWGSDLETVPVTFRQVCEELQQTHQRQDECIDFVAFGLHDMLLIRYENGKSQLVVSEEPAKRALCSQALIEAVEQRIADGWTFGDRSSLCHCDARCYFIEWQKGSAAEFSYDFGSEERLDDLRIVQSVLSGEGNDVEYVRRCQAEEVVRMPLPSCLSDYADFRQAAAKQFQRDSMVAAANPMNQQAANTRALFFGNRCY